MWDAHAPTEVSQPPDYGASDPESDRFSLLVVIGPTGAGKSELALFLAEQFGGEIVGCDSVQVYRGLNIGANKIAIEERHAVPHHLLDVIDPDDYMTAARYSLLARQAISDVQSRGKLAIVVGGTGFYLRALLDGLSPAPTRDEQIRARLSILANRRPGVLHRFLRLQDPAAAARIHANDRQKLIRAIELILLARRPATVTQSLPRDPLPGAMPLKLGLAPDRKLLNDHLDQRSEWIFLNGLLAETKALLDAGLSPEAKPLQSLGYKQAVKALFGEMSIEEAIRDCKLKTRQYAKRQMTWFRREARVHWLNGFGTQEKIKRQAFEIAASAKT